MVGSLDEFFKKANSGGEKRKKQQILTAKRKTSDICQR